MASLRPSSEGPRSDHRSHRPLLSCGTSSAVCFVPGAARCPTFSRQDCRVPTFADRSGELGIFFSPDDIGGLHVSAPAVNPLRRAEVDHDHNHSGLTLWVACRSAACFRDGRASVLCTLHVVDQLLSPQWLFSPPHMQYMDFIITDPVVDPTRTDPNLAIVRARKFGNLSSHFFETRKMICDFNDLLNHCPCCFWFVESNEGSDGVKLEQSRLGPDHLSHLASLRFASVWETVRPSRIACSPRAIPSRTEIRRFISSKVETSTR